jgi:hypothetical protein
MEENTQQVKSLFSMALQNAIGGPYQYPCEGDEDQGGSDEEGSIITEVDNLGLRDLVGEYSATLTNPDRAFLPPPAPYRILVSITAPAFSEYWDLVGRVTYPADDPQFTISAPAHILRPTTCWDFVAGPAPVGRCFSMMENFRGAGAYGYPAGGADVPPDTFAYGSFTLSMQADGSLYYLYQQGVPGVVQVPSFLPSHVPSFLPLSFHPPFRRLVVLFFSFIYLLPSLIYFPSFLCLSLLPRFFL